MKHYAQKFIGIKLSNEEIFSLAEKYDKINPFVDCEDSMTSIITDGYMLHEVDFKCSEEYIFNKEIHNRFDVTDIYSDTDEEGGEFMPLFTNEGLVNNGALYEEEFNDFCISLMGMMNLLKNISEINSLDDIVDMAKKIIGKYVSEDFNWKSHIGIISYTIYCD